MFITKSLFKEFTQSPKLAWYSVNDKKTHQKIQEYTYGGMDGAAMGQTVEDMAKKLYKGKTIAEVDSKKINYKARHQSYAELTSKTVAQNPDVIYQAGFATSELFAKTDFLVKNEGGTYDLVEVKSKNAIRKDNKAQTLDDELAADVSFQKYVLERTLGKKFSGNCFIMYLNKEYTKHGEINPSDILLQERVNDDLMTDDAIEGILKTMGSDLSLSLKEFDTKYPYDGGDYLTYFGEEPPKDSIRSIAGIDKKKKQALYEAGKILIKDLTDEDILTILSNKDGSESRSSQYMNLRKQGETVIDKKGIKEIFDGLTFPLFFYDYETVATPIPLFDGTKPWQAAVVQYSLHKMEKDGTTTHNESIIGLKAPDIKKVIDQFVKDVGEPKGTFIAWNKGFECGKNSETAVMYPEYKDFYEKVNAQTFDLMDIFKSMQYFHRGFLGSASIKKVLPALTDLSYDDLEVGNGGMATALLQQIVLGTIDPKEYPSAVKNLLTYCEQDTWAMVRIWEVVKEEIG